MHYVKIIDLLNLAYLFRKDPKGFVYQETERLLQQLTDEELPTFKQLVFFYNEGLISAVEFHNAILNIYDTEL